MQANVRQSNMMNQAPVDNFFVNPPPTKQASQIDNFFGNAPAIN